MIRNVVALLCLLASPLAAQMSMDHDHAAMTAVGTNVEQLVEQARSAAEIYSDRSVAIERGYRRVGRDLPMMGEHWLNTRLLVDGVFDISRPAILTYLDVDGTAVLTGVVFAMPLDLGESPPDVFGPGAMWHEHNGSIDEEALVPEHHTMPSAATGTRVAFLHVWTHAQFAGSVFDAENWTLPFLRAGVAVPAHFTFAAAKCLSVATGARDYYRDVYHLRDTRAFDECASFVVKRGSSLSDAELAALDSAWQRAQSVMKGGS
jgi:hypothetical protein